MFDRGVQNECRTKDNIVKTLHKYHLSEFVFFCANGKNNTSQL